MSDREIPTLGTSSLSPASSSRLVSFQASDSAQSEARVVLGQRMLGRALAVPFNYAELYRDPDAARRGEFDPDELLAKSTCASNGGEDES
ncbi:hypothetical protein BQ8794_260023 [Mesorhizobium prunaredense]|uniref:Uncharacterized protein n=1 Tax=Mesorhizobium prunaredense TaxID=1631249 RepID=A0A1R3V8E5_9HYPH|nr:hypothetical protein [Mesorhizobium prunaredense]SIT56167.1 hypothetical protein BQ8794_260023 [Mesorhizobium prunaredense]